MSDILTAIVLSLMATIFIVLGFSIGKENAYQQVMGRCVKDNQSLVYQDVIEKCNYLVKGNE